MKKYFVNEVFYSLQGEGVRVGTPNVFVRFGKCNQSCRIETHGFDCDTEFESGRWLSAVILIEEMSELDVGLARWCILTGGEPGIQVDSELIDSLHDAGWKVAIETNGSIELPNGIDWVCVSPKVAEHAIRQLVAHEVRYVRGIGQTIPRPVVRAKHYLLSPAFNGDTLDHSALRHCIKLCLENPQWRLSVQQHKLWGVR